MKQEKYQLRGAILIGYTKEIPITNLPLTVTLSCITYCLHRLGRGSHKSNWTCTSKFTGKGFYNLFPVTSTGHTPPWSNQFSVHAQQMVQPFSV